MRHWIADNRPGFYPQRLGHSGSPRFAQPRHQNSRCHNPFRRRDPRWSTVRAVQAGEPPTHIRIDSRYVAYQSDKPLVVPRQIAPLTVPPLLLPSVDHLPLTSLAIVVVPPTNELQGTGVPLPRSAGAAVAPKRRPRSTFS